MSTSEQNSKTAEAKEIFIRSFDEALRAIQEYDREKNKILVPPMSDLSPIPSHNELRYAIRHLIDAVNKETNGSESSDDWVRAKRHTERALYDVAEFEASTLINQIQGFLKEYSKYERLLARYIDNYYGHLRNHNNYFKFLSNLHEFDKVSREYTEQSRTFIEQMRCFWQDILAGKHNLFQAIERESRTTAMHKRINRYIFWGIAIVPSLIKLVSTMFHCAAQ